MKKLLQFMLLCFVIGISNAQTPVHRFNFENNLQNTANNLILAGANINYEAGRNAAAGQAMVINNNVSTTNSYIDSAITGLSTSGGAFSFCFWAKFNNNTQSGKENRLLTIGTRTTVSGVNGGFSFWQDVNSLSTERFWVNYGSASFGADSWTSTAGSGASTGWNFYTFVYSGSGTTKLYKNGVQQSTNSTTNITLGNLVLKMGRWNDSVFDNFPKGSFSIDDLQLFNVALTDAQITSIYTPAQIPTISLVSSSIIGTATSTINYSINAGGAATTPIIRYGLSSANLNLSQTGAVVNGSTTTAQSINLSSLAAGTAYFYRVEASNSAGNATPSSILSFTTTAATPAPTITNLTATNVTFNAATVNFNLNAFGSATTYIVEYTTDVLAPWQTQSGGTTSVNTSTAFNVQLTNLLPNRRYFIRVRATNATSQVTLSSEIQFNTPTPIVLTNLNDSNVTATTAQINYTLNTNGFNAFIEIRYQASTAFNSDNPFTTVVISNFTVNNTSATNYNYVLTGLLPNTTYSYQFGAVTQNFGGVETGENNAFRTTPSLGLNDNTQRLNFSMYPNPANSIINIDLASEVKSVEVYSLLGQKVLSVKENQINISNLSNGVYMVKVEDENGAVATQKLVKQ